MATGDYCTLDEFKAARRFVDPLDDAEVAACITVASDQVNRYCGRRFYLDASATARTFVPSGTEFLEVPDMGVAPTSVVSNGTTMTAGTHYFLEPQGLFDEAGLPAAYTSLRRIGGVWGLTGSASIAVTAQWGWPAVPASVKRAAIILTADLLSGRDNTFGVVGLDVGAVVRLKINTLAAALLGPYRRGGSAPGLAVA